MLSSESDLGCPLSIKVAQDKCKAAELVVGGVLQHDANVVEGSWDNKTNGCFFVPEIHYNTNCNTVKNNFRAHIQIKVHCPMPLLK